MEISNSLELHEAITALEKKRRELEQDLSEHFKYTYQSLQPLNILKKTLQGVTGSPGMRSNLINAGLGVGAGLLSRKLFFGGTGSLFKKLLGTAVEFGVAKTVTNKSGGIVSKGLHALKRLVSKN